MIRDNFGKKVFVNKAFIFGVILCFLGGCVTPALSGSSGIWITPEQRSSSIRDDFNFDIAYVNNIYAELPEESGMMFVAASFGLVINCGSEPIAKEDLDAAGIVITSTIQGACMDVGFMTDNQYTPIQATTAWGSVNDQNLFLVDLLENGEVLQNMTPSQTFYLSVYREYYTGIATFHISIQIRNRIIYLETTITFVDSSEVNVVLIGGERADSMYHPNQPPLIPTISGPTLGKINTNYTFSVGSITDPDEDQLYVKWDWGDDTSSGWLGPYDSGATIKATHAWSEPNTYTIRAILKDVWGVTSNWSDPFLITIVENEPPTINGPHCGKINIAYTFTLGEIIYPEEDQFYVLWGWGDGTTSDWLGPFNSGETIQASHTWTAAGTYSITVKLRDSEGAESNWSEPFIMHVTSKVFLFGVMPSIEDQIDDCVVLGMFIAVIIQGSPVKLIMCPFLAPVLVMLDEFQGYVGTWLIAGVLYALVLND